MKTLLAVMAGSLLAIFPAHFAAARGMGGAHGGGGYSGSHEGSYSGSHYSGSHEGSYSNGSYSGSHEGGYNGAHYSGSHEGSTSDGTHTESREGSYNGANYSGSHEETGSVHASNGEISGVHAGGVSGTGAEGNSFHAGSVDAGGYHAGGLEASGYHGSLPTDAGFGAVGGGGAVAGAAYAGNHVTQPLNGSLTAARGAAVRNSYSGAGTFNGGWYGAHPGAWAATGWSAGQAWQPAAWAGVDAALGWGAAVQPIPYNYGTNVTYQNNQVYYGDQPAATADQYYQQAATIAQAAPAPADQSPDWTPLGVFALVQNDQDTPHYIMQIAVNKSGAIGGNYVDLLSDTIIPIHGSVDKKTQRVAWIVGTKKENVGETGIYNLTQSEAPVLIHQGPDKTQQWLLVRLKQPDESAPAN